MEWLLEQIGRLTNFLSSASEDIEDFTVNVQNRIEKYRNFWNRSWSCGASCFAGGFFLNYIINCRRNRRFNRV